MSDITRYISKVEIKGLWGRFDLSWDLNEDVNVLSGGNGSGKSTILKCVYSVLMDIPTSNSFWDGIDEIGKFIVSCKVSFGNRYSLLYRFVKANDKARNEEIEKEFSKIENTIHRHTGTYYGGTFNVYISGDIIWETNKLFKIDLISTFDAELKPSEAIQKIADPEVETELDWEIYHLQKKYLEYKLNLAQKTIEAISKNDSNGELIKLQANQNRFLEIIDLLFLQTGKKINRKENEISFLSGEEKISSYQLSSGEKQMLIIMLTVLVQDGKNAILFMDEPEISLHFDWQKKLIGYIRELNPNVQIILATHSPAVIMEGWMDKVANVSDLITPTYKSEVNAA